MKTSEEKRAEIKLVRIVMVVCVMVMMNDAETDTLPTADCRYPNYDSFQTAPIRIATSEEPGMLQSHN